MRCLHLTLLGVAAVAIGTLLFWRYAERRWYEGLLPASLKVSSIMALETESGLLEGCGTVVFMLDPQIAGQVRSAGLAAFVDARQARAEPGSSYSYEAWRETPALETGDGHTRQDRWLNGLGCAQLDPDLAKTINGALRAKGSFVSRGQERGLVVLPTEGLLVLSFEG